MATDIIVINSTYTYLKDWVHSIPLRFENEGDILYNARNQIRLLHTPDGIAVCVKRFCCPRPFNRLVYTTLRQPKAIRAYNNALRLTKLGISTPCAVGYILEKEHGLLTYSYLVTLYLDHTRDLYSFRNEPLEKNKQVVQQLAIFAAHMHSLGVIHKDFSPGNILYTTNENGDLKFSLIDINRMHFGHIPGMKEACRNFQRLWGGDEYLRAIAKVYAQQRGWNEAQTEKWILFFHHRFWKHRS